MARKLSLKNVPLALEEEQIAAVMSKRKEQSNLRLYRRAKGLTLEMLSELTGISPSYLSRLEAGARRLNSDLMEKLSIVLSCSPGDLLNSSPKPTLKLAHQESGKEAHEGPQKDLPIFSGPDMLGETSQDGKFMPVDFENPADWTFRIPQLAGIKTAFALSVRNTQNAPRYLPGDLLLVHPTRPLAHGCSVMAVSKNDEVVIQRFLGWENDELILSSFNDDNKKTKVAKDQLKAIYRIIGTLEAH